MRNLLLATAVWLSVSTTPRAQQLEHFDLLLLSMSRQNDSSWRPAAPRFLTAFNPKGYNNQPQFFSTNELYLTVQLPADTTQTEIFALQLPARPPGRITATTTPEYSPTPMPGGKAFSAVRVEADGAQRLWAFPLDRSDNGRPLLPNIRNVGYHCWLRDTLVALFLVGENDEPHALAMAGISRQAMQRVAFNIGRCLQKMPDGRLAFVQKATEQTWFIKAYDPLKKTSDIIVKTLPGSEDFVFLPDGTLLAGSGSKLFQYRPGRHTEWKEMYDLSRFGVRNITRLAVSPDMKLAVVVQ